MRICPSQSTVMKRKVGIDDFVHHREIQPIALCNWAPVVHSRAAERIHAQPQLRAADGLHVEHIGEIIDVRMEKIMPVRRRGALGLVESHSLHALQATFQKRISPRSNPSCDVLIGRPAVGRVVLEAAVVGRIVRGCNDDAVRESRISRRPAAVVREYGVGDHWRRGVFVAIREHDLHTVGREHLERAGTRRHGKRMRVDAEEQRAADACAACGNRKSPD